MFQACGYLSPSDVASLWMILVSAKEFATVPVNAFLPSLVPDSLGEDLIPWASRAQLREDYDALVQGKKCVRVFGFVLAFAPSGVSGCTL